MKEKATACMKMTAKKGECSQDRQFTVSHDWFKRFRNQYNYNNIKMTGEVPTNDFVTAKFFTILESIVMERVYSVYD